MCLGFWHTLYTSVINSQNYKLNTFLFKEHQNNVIHIKNVCTTLLNKIMNSRYHGNVIHSLS